MRLTAFNRRDRCGIPVAPCIGRDVGQFKELALGMAQQSADLIGPCARETSYSSLQPLAIELDLVNPTCAARHLIDRRCQGRRNEAGKKRPCPDRLGLRLLKRHNALRNKRMILNS